MHEELRMQPLPETTSALAALARGTDGAGDRLAESFTAAAETARRIAPDCVGLTLSFLREGMSFTWVATDLRAAVLDGIQYLDGGPCVQAVADEALTVDVEEAHQGGVMEALGQRRADLQDMVPDGRGRVRLEYRVPARGLIGFQGEFMNLTRGTGLMSHVFDDYAPLRRPAMSPFIGA